MKKNGTQWIWGLSIIAILFLLGLFINPAFIHTAVFKHLFGHLILDSIVFIIACHNLRKFEEMTFWRWVLYITLTTAISVWTPVWGKRLWSYHPILWASLMASAFVVINVFFWKMAFKTTTRQTWLLGCIITCFDLNVYLLTVPILK